MEIKLNVELIEILTFLYRKNNNEKTMQKMIKILINNPFKFFKAFLKI